MSESTRRSLLVGSEPIIATTANSTSVSTAPAMTAAELYRTDSTFRALIASWIAEKRCPYCMADYLRDCDLWHLAPGAEWAATEPDRPEFLTMHALRNANDFKGNLIGPYPSVADGSGERGYWFAEWPPEHANCLPYRLWRAVDQRHPGPLPLTFPEALCALLDGFADAIADGWKGGAG